MQKIITFVRKHKWYIVLFLLFLEIAILTPISGDDWGNYSHFKSLASLINYSKSFYYSWEGRVISRFLIGLLTYHKYLWDIIFPTLMILLIYFMNSFFNKENNKNIFFLSILVLLLINNVMFAQTYTWIAGSITYFYPTVLVFCYFIYIFDKKIKDKIFNNILLLLINVVGTMFVEHIGVALVFGNLLYVIYYYLINKKISIKSIIFLLISAAGLVFMLKSPGSAARLATNVEFNKMSLFAKLDYNKYEIIKYLYERNVFIILIMLIPILLVVFKRINNKKLRIILMAIFSLIPVLTIINNLILFVPLEIKLKPFNYSDNYLFLIYWILFTILYFIAILFSNFNNYDKIKIICLFLIGLSSMGAIALTPGFSDRVAFFNLVILLTVSLKIISRLKIFNSKLFSKTVKLVLILLIIYYLLAFIFIGIYNNKRINYIKKCIKSNDKVIVIKSNPIYLIWNNNPSNEYHMETFKKYFKIPKEVEVSVAWLMF